MDSSIDDFHYISKLKGAENYKMWEVYVRSSLILNRTFYVVKDTYEIPPNPNSKSNNTINASDQELWEKYEKDNEMALAGIHITCTKQMYAYIEHINTAQGAWAKFKQLFATDTYHSIKSVYFTLHNLRSDQFKDLYAYLAKFKELANRLSGCGEPISKMALAMIFDHGLPEHLSLVFYIYYQIARSKKEDVDFDYVTMRLSEHLK